MRRAGQLVALLLGIAAGTPYLVGTGYASSLLPIAYWEEDCAAEYGQPVCKLLRLYAEAPPAFPEQEAAFRAEGALDRLVVRFRDYEFHDVFQTTWQFQLNYRWLGFRKDFKSEKVVSVGLFAVLLTATCPYWPCTEVKAVGMLTKQSGDDPYDEQLWLGRLAEWKKLEAEK